VPYLKQNLTPKCLEHSFGVMVTMEKLAMAYGLEKRKIIRSRLLHDAAKELSFNEQGEKNGFEKISFSYGHHFLTHP